MPSLELLVSFVIATSIFAYMPGPPTLYAAARTIARGRRAGWFAALGIHLGGYVHVIAAAVGLAFLFEAVPTLYLAQKFAGAAYLIWLGVTMFVAKQDANDAVDALRPSCGSFNIGARRRVQITANHVQDFQIRRLQNSDRCRGFRLWQDNIYRQIDQR